MTISRSFMSLGGRTDIRVWERPRGTTLPPNSASEENAQLINEAQHWPPALAQILLWHPWSYGECDGPGGTGAARTDGMYHQSQLHP